MKICLAGEGAIARAHAEAIAQIDGVEIAVLAGGIKDDAEAFAREWKIPDITMDLREAVTRPRIEAVILATPTPLHTEQAEYVIAQGKHVFLEIPMAETVAQSERLAALDRGTDLVCMVGHSRRFQAPHVEMKRRIKSGEFHLQHLLAETYFFRRTNLNMLGKPRTWVDNLLWHHACHSVDLVCWLLDEEDMDVWGQAGPLHPELGIHMDMSICMRSKKTGALITMALSFNNQGPFGGFYRFIGQEGTFHAYREKLSDFEHRDIAIPGRAMFDQDSEFFNAIREKRKPEASFASCLAAMRLLGKIEASFANPFA